MTGLPHQVNVEIRACLDPAYEIDRLGESACSDLNRWTTDMPDTCADHVTSFDRVAAVSALSLNGVCGLFASRKTTSRIRRRISDFLLSS